MAINFPNTPTNGNTYDYLGVRYTFNKAVGDVGFWQVTTPGSFGVASAAEIDTGTDAVKYVTPLELEQSGYTNNYATAAMINSGSASYDDDIITPAELALSDYLQDPGDLMRSAEYGSYSFVQGEVLYVSGLSPSWQELTLTITNMNMLSVTNMYMRFNAISSGYVSGFSNHARTHQGSQTVGLSLGYHDFADNIIGTFQLVRYGSLIMMTGSVGDTSDNDFQNVLGKIDLGAESGRNFTIYGTWNGGTLTVTQKK